MQINSEQRAMLRDLTEHLEHAPRDQEAVAVAIGMALARTPRTADPRAIARPQVD